MGRKVSAMKYPLNAILLFFLSKSVAAAAPLLELHTSGGFVTPEASGWSSGLKIEEDGKVKTYYRKNKSSSMIEQVFFELPGGAMEKIRIMVSHLPKKGEMETSKDPECADAPLVKYQARGTLLFALQKNCQTRHLKSAYTSRQLRQLLDALYLLVPDGQK